MNGVLGMAGLLADTSLDQRQQHYVDVLHQSGEALLAIINDILDFAKAETGKLEIERIDFDLVTEVESVLELVVSRAHAKGIELGCFIGPDVPPRLNGDPGRLRQILLNLLSNAVKFTEQGAIMVHVRGTANGLTLRVVDTGCGIPPEHLPRLARPFEQVEQELTRTNAGTGLGLALTKSLTEMHGGKLSIQSEVGRGTIVTITLPRYFGGRRAATPEATAAE
jgi:signal transduction histidine kinase